ncbi:MAG: peptidylprolyl isomerase [Chloroflexota bacterium]
MAKNKKTMKPKKEISRQQLSNWQKQQKRQRLVLNISIAVVAVVFLVIGVGWYLSDYQPRHQKVLVVNGTVFRMNDYLTALKYYSGDSAAAASQIEPSLVSYIMEGEFIKRGAQELEVSVTDDEVEAEIKNRSLRGEYLELVRMELTAQKVLENFASGVPTYAEHRHLKALFVESESRALDVLEGIKAGDDFGEVAGLLSEDSYTRQQKGDLGFKIKEVLALPSYLGTSAVGDYAFNAPLGNSINLVRDDAKSKKLGYWLIKVVEQDTQVADNQTARVRISGILLGSFAEAEKVKARLDSGEDFAALAGGFSQDKSSREQGGDLGWFSQDTIRPAFKSFALESAVTPGKVSDIIRDTATVTTGGYWLVEVLEIEENREVSSDDRALLAQAAYGDWFTSHRTSPDNKIEILITERQRSWAVTTAIGELSR